ncbi:5483_t:CDS:1 [Dentiscutata heterogama]|uniref:5483_t:CDS:1 n=1 Tax=Dentiscutata heterogama TaxID=1316150 RepID=A0ACA9LS49_9GLOM|nr:5483_t:CDS:1 [Dentiscutata heterogama]
MVDGQSGVLSGSNPLNVNATDPLTLAIVQIVIIIVFTRILHLGLKRIRQPRVISEVIGGIILGPSVLGHIPGYLNTMFSSASLTYLNLLANLGLVLYLFIVGLELNPKMIKKNIKSVIFISASGIILPFVMGIGVAYGLYDAMDNHAVVDSSGVSHNVPFTSFVLFICIAMAITAFPVLARILSELKLMKTTVGNCALNSAVGDDITAWILLAIVIAIINASNYLTALYSFLICVFWTLIVGFVIRPILLKFIIATNSNYPSPSTLMVAITLSVVLISAFITNIIGIHYIFGGFIIGVILPHEGGFAVGITEKIEDLISVLLIPIYFTLSGLKTNISDLGAAGWGWAILIIVVAMFGKILGCTAAAKATGLTFRESLTVGVFMSCKGLVELIILNVGYDAKIINSKVFSIMVVMALVTTFVTTPLASYLYPVRYQRKMEYKRTNKDSESKLLVVLNKVENLPAMITFVQLLQHKVSTKPTLLSSDDKTDSSIIKDIKPMNVHVLRLIELTQRMSAVMKFNEISETILHDPIMNMFSVLSQISSMKVNAKLAVTSPKDFCQEITEKIQDDDINLVIIPWDGAGEIVDTPIENEDNALREKKHTSPQVASFIQDIFNDATDYASVGVFVDRGFGSTDNTYTLSNPTGYLNVFMPFFGGADDREALTFVFRLLEYPNVNITVFRIIKSEQPTDNDVTLKPEIQSEILNVNEKDRSSLDRRISTITISEATAHRENEEDESFLEKYLKSKSGYPARNARISYQEVSSYTPIQTAVERAKKVVSRKDLVIVGRNRHSQTNERHHHYEFRELIKNLGSYGNDTHKSLGYVTEAFLVGGIMASLLVLQAKQVKEVKDDKMN